MLLAADARSLDRAVAALALVLFGLRQFVHSGVTSGYLVALVLVPVWWPVLRRYRGARPLLALGAVAVVFGTGLSVFAPPEHVVDPSVRIFNTGLLVGTLAGVGVVLWARERIGGPATGFWYGVGLLGNAVLTRGAGLGNPWKFTWVIPGAVLLLALAAMTRRVLVEVASLALLVVVSAVTDSRSYAATFALGIVLLFWRSVARPGRGRVSWIRGAVLAALLSAGVYYLARALLVAGYLGRTAQERSIAQIRAAGSLILGGRPELAATAALIRDHPWGFGFGVAPNPSDVLVAKQGMAAIGYAPDNGYVDQFMFGGHVELHSLTGDLWASTGPVGLLLAVVVLLLVLRGLVEGVLRHRVSVLVVFLAVWSLWNVFFSPIYSSVPTLVLALGLVLPRRDDDPRPAGPPAPAAPR